MYFHHALPPKEPVIKPYVEIRERFERRTDRDFFAPARDNRSDLFGRYRVGCEITFDKQTTASVQYQYAHDLIWTNAKNFSRENSDIGVAQLKYKSGNWTAIGGRQKINVGTERLIGAAEWLNVPRSYDGLRLTSKEWDIWAVAIGVASPRPRYARVAGASLNWDKTEQTSAFYKHDKVGGVDTDIVTFDHRGTRKFGTLVFDYEGALQFGRSANKDVEAWAFHAGVSHQANKRMRFYAEVNSASGGSTATKVRTFDNLYPTNHKFYGIMDLQSWKNMNQLVLGLDIKPDAKSDLRFSWRAFSLRDPRDAWYGASGAPNKRPGGGNFIDPTGLSGRDVGSEMDFDSSFKYDKNTTIQFGLAIFTPGRFIRNLNGGTAMRQCWGYLSVQVRY
jgi:hypothetical protein